MSPNRYVSDTIEGVNCSSSPQGSISWTYSPVKYVFPQDTNLDIEIYAQWENTS